MSHFDEELHSAVSNGQKQRFDNFHFTSFEAIVVATAARGGNVEAAVTLDALSEVPEQFRECRRLRLLK